MPHPEALSAQGPTSQGEVARLLASAILADPKRPEGGYSRKFFKTDVDAVNALACLARGTENSLAGALARPAVALTVAIGDFICDAEAVKAAAERVQHADWQAAAERALDQLHFALAVISRNLIPMLRVFARDSRNSDFLCEAINHTIGDGPEAAKLIEHYAKVCPDEFKTDDGRAEPESWPDHFAWDACLRLAALDEMADRFPAHVKTAARQMNAWPMLRYRHTDTKARFETLAERLELGADYPLDTSKSARFRPDTPMVRYLDRLVYRLHSFRQGVAWARQWGEDETKLIDRLWRQPDETDADDSVVSVLRTALGMKALTKRTAPTWAKRVVVPYILAVDAKTSETCVEPALKAIWNQHGKTGRLKSRADFKSRLTPDVIKSLRSIARPA